MSTQASARRLPRIIVRPPTVVLCTALILLEGSALVSIPFLAALCHEMGHLAVMSILGVRVSEIELTVFGAEIRTLPMSVGAAGSAVIYGAGAAANLMSAAAVLAIFGDSFGGRFFAACSLSLAALNLLPIRTLDGGCILEAVLGYFVPAYADAAVNAVSGMALFILWLGAVYLLLVCGGNLSLLLFCMYLFVTLYMRE